jgi:hypothetical protein
MPPPQPLRSEFDYTTWLWLTTHAHCIAVACTCSYQGILAVQPGNVEALRYLVAMCQELGRPAEVERYAEMLRTAERAEVSAMHASLACVLARQAGSAD